MAALYNEIERYPAEWLRNLIDAQQIAPGAVDDRSIADLKPTDVAGAVQFHTFAGVGIWSLALRLAGWPDDRAVWTGSCPCQPFSTAGKRAGRADARHLWPAWFRLIDECRPPVVFGEQVAGPDGLRWFDAVRADLEGSGYAVGVANLAAAGVGAPHIRHRLYFVAVANADRVGPQGVIGAGATSQTVERGGEPGGLADGEGIGRGQGRVPNRPRPGQGAGPSDGGRMGDSDGQRLDGQSVRLQRRGPHQEGPQAAGPGTPCGMGDADRDATGRVARGAPGAQGEARSMRAVDHGPRPPGDIMGRIPDAWADAEWLACSDGKARPAQSGVHPLAHGAPNRVGRLRAYGNGLVATQAATFIRAAMMSIDAMPWGGHRSMLDTALRMR